MRKNFMKQLRDNTVERFFADELDEAYRLGLIEGSTRALSQARMKIDTGKKHLSTQKQAGADFAMEIMDEVKSRWRQI